MKRFQSGGGVPLLCGILLCSLCGVLLTGCGDAFVEIPPAESSSAMESSSTTTAPCTMPSTETTTTTAPPQPYAYLQAQIAQMTLEEQVAQMLLVCCYTSGAEAAAAGGAGGICLFEAAFAGKSKAEVIAMTDALQSMAELPLLIAVDEEGGGVVRISSNPQLRETPFLRPGKVYANGGWAHVTADTHEKSALLLQLGINVNLAPVCDVPQKKGDYIYWRCFDTDPQETARYVDVVVAEMERSGIGSTLKHFPGYGGSADTHKGMAYDNRDYEAFEQGDLLPFIAGIAAGADSVMVSHNIVRCMDAEHPASLSPAVHEILRQELDFAGVIMTDDLGMQAIRSFCGAEHAAVLAVEAGNDLLCCPDFEIARDAICAAVRSERIPAEQISESVLRILIWKTELGLLPA